MKDAVAGELAAAYHSAIVDDVRANDYQYQSGRLTVHLAREFGFCYGVDRAVDYAYQARRRFPGRQRVPDRRDHPQPARQRSAPRSRDPVPQRSRRGLDAARPGRRRHPAGVRRDGRRNGPAGGQGCTLVDTTCGSVLNVWKNVVRYAQDGFTAIIHGKVQHEETRATASQALKYPQRALPGGARPRTKAGSSATSSGTAAIRRRSWRVSARRVSPGFDPTRDLQRVGCANQTTMLMTESLEIGEMFRAAMADRYGEAELADAFPRLRHDLQRHAGAPGRGDCAARRSIGSI